VKRAPAAVGATVGVARANAPGIGCVRCEGWRRVMGDGSRHRFTVQSIYNSAKSGAKCFDLRAPLFVMESGFFESLQTAHRTLASVWFGRPAQA